MCLLCFWRHYFFPTYFLILCVCVFAVFWQAHLIWKNKNTIFKNFKSENEKYIFVYFLRIVEHFCFEIIIFHLFSLNSFYFYFLLKLLWLYPCCWLEIILKCWRTCSVSINSGLKHAISISILDLFQSWI